MNRRLLSTSSLSRRLPACCCALLLSTGAIAQPLPVDGQVAAVDSRIVRIELVTELGLVTARTAYLGAPVYIFRRTMAGQRRVDVRIATLITLEGSLDTLYAIASGGSRIPSMIAVGDRVVVDWPDDPALVDLSSSPDGAEISWHGHVLGTTPIQLDLFPGDYSFRFTLEHYEPATENVTLGPGGSLSLGRSMGVFLSAGELLTRGERASNGLEDLAAEEFLRLALETNELYGGLEPNETEHCRYLLTTIDERQKLADYARERNYGQEQIDEMVRQYSAIRRQMEGVDPESPPQAVVGFTENLYTIMREYPMITQLYREYVLPAREADGR